MPCFICKTKTGPFQRLEVARLRFIRKAQPQFKDDSYLCPKCFKQFERIYKSKKSKNDTTSSQPSISNASIRTVSTKSNSSGNSTRSHLTIIQKSNENDNDIENNSSSNVIQFDSRSLESHNSSIDSTDKIVQMAPNYLSIRDSSRKTAKNPVLNVARQGAEAAVRRALNRTANRTLPKEPTPVQTSDGNNSSINVIPFDSRSMDAHSSSVDSTDRIVQMATNILSLRDSTPKTANNAELNVARHGAEAAVRSALKRQGQVTLREDSPPARRRRLDIVDEEDTSESEEEIQLSPGNLAHVRPIARRRREPVVQQFGDVMDNYLAKTSGG